MASQGKRSNDGLLWPEFPTLFSVKLGTIPMIVKKTRIDELLVPPGGLVETLADI